MSYELQHTTDYDLFDASLCREPGSLKGLSESMEKHGYRPAYPLHVVRGENDKLTVKAGGRRLAAAKQLGIPVYYVVDDDEMSRYELEGHKKRQ